MDCDLQVPDHGPCPEMAVKPLTVVERSEPMAHASAVAGIVTASSFQGTPRPVGPRWAAVTYSFDAVQLASHSLALVDHPLRARNIERLGYYGK
jgi:hypothetical protein